MVHFAPQLSVLSAIVLVVISGNTTLADDHSVCADEKAAAATRISACTNIIRRYRPSSSGSASAAIAYNQVQIAYLNRIDLYDRGGKQDLALKDAEAAIKLGQNDPMVAFFYLSRKDLHVKMREFDRAIAWLTAAINNKVKYPPTSDLYVLRASVWYARGDLDRAIADQSEAIRLAPDTPIVYGDRADYWYEKGDFERALADHNEAIRRKAADGDSYVRRAAFWKNRGDIERAMADYAEAIRLNPTSGYAYGNRALLWRDLGEFDRALADYDESVKRFPQNGSIRASRGEIWRLKGDLDRALEDQNEGLKLYPRNAVVLILRGDTLRYKGDFRGALADYDLAQQQGPTSVIPAATGRGLTYEKMGDFTKARSEFATAVKAGGGRTLVDIEKSSYTTAQARLAALDSGAPQPVIPAAPSKVTSPTAIPTVAIAPPVIAPEVAQTAATAHGRRVALVIGNSAYQKVGALANPQRDAEAVAQALRNIGFDSVTLASDATREKLAEALRTFADEAEKADWAMVYYAGHGIEVSGVNYLLPVEAKVAADRDVQFEAVPLDQVMAAVEQARKLKLIVLDACRDNPFVPQMRRTAAPEAVARASTAGGAIATRSIGRGLGEVKITGATLVVYAAKHGQIALDGEGGNSPFVTAFLQRIATPGVEINKLFRLVRDDVMELTAGRQEPYTYGSLPGREDFFFVAK